MPRFARFSIQYYLTFLVTAFLVTGVKVVKNATPVVLKRGSTFYNMFLVTCYEEKLQWVLPVQSCDKQALPAVHLT